MRKSSVVASLFLFVPFSVSPSLYADVVQLEASQDNTLFENPQGVLSNGAGTFLFAGTTAQRAIRRALVAFDLTAAIPSGSTVNSVSVSLTMSRTIAGNEMIDVHRVLAGWGEGTSNASAEEGGGTVATTGDATWLHRFFRTQLWNAAGGDFSPSASASRTVANLGRYTWESTPGLVGDVQMWVNSPETNFGWLLKETAESRSFTAKRFNSREHPTAASRPVLRVDFTPPLSGPVFRRGDATGDGMVDLSDAVAVLETIFLTGVAFPCGDAADANDDGALDISDAVTILLRVFGANDDLPLPGSEACGEDPTADGLECSNGSPSCA